LILIDEQTVVLGGDQLTLLDLHGSKMTSQAEMNLDSADGMIISL
jgi:hypothetical protein